MNQILEISKEQLERVVQTPPSTIKELTNYFNVSSSTIKRRLKRFSLSTFKRVFNEKLFRVYYRQGLIDIDIAKKLKVSHGTISNYRNSLHLDTVFPQMHSQI